MVEQSGLGDRLHVNLISATGKSVSAQVHGVIARRGFGQRHQVLAVLRDVDHIMIKRVFLSGDTPRQRLPGECGGNGHAVVDAGFDFRAFLVIIPGNKLQERQLVGRGVMLGDIGEARQPRLSALLVHHAVRGPARLCCR